MDFKTKLTAAGQRNVSAQISGILKVPAYKTVGSTKVVEDKVFKLVQFEQHGLKMTSIVFLVQEKAGLRLWWNEKREDLILPAESRGAFRFDIGLRPPDNWDGAIWASPFKVDETKGFLLLLDFDR
jgi:hypothetical protein